MRTRRRWIALSLSLIVILALAAFSTPVRGVIQSGQPGGFFSMPWGDLVDSRSGEQYGLTLIAREDDSTPGVGQVTLQLLGPGVSACSTHGGGVDIGTTEDGENYSGNFPLTEIQCGTAYGMAVSVDGCTLKGEMHGYSHSDYPLTIYTGSNTVELTFKKTATGGQVSLQISTPRGPIKLAGNVTGDVVMDTCP